MKRGNGVPAAGIPPRAAAERAPIVSLSDRFQTPEQTADNEFASGGGTSESVSYSVAGVTGVWQAGTSTSSTFAVSGGFLEAAGDADPRAPACPADVTGDGAVDGADLATLLGNWANPGVADFDRSGAVDGADLATLLGAWGPCPVP